MGFLISSSYIVLTNSYGNAGFVVLGIGLGVAGFVCNCFANDVDQGLSFKKLNKAAFDTSMEYGGAWANIPLG